MQECIGKTITVKFAIGIRSSENKCILQSQTSLNTLFYRPQLPSRNHLMWSRFPGQYSRQVTTKTIQGRGLLLNCYFCTDKMRIRFLVISSVHHRLSLRPTSHLVTRQNNEKYFFWGGGNQRPFSDVPSSPSECGLAAHAVGTGSDCKTVSILKADSVVLLQRRKIYLVYPHRIIWTRRKAYKS